MNLTTLLTAADAWPADFPEVSGGVVGHFDVKVRVELPLNRHTEGLLTGRRDAWEKHTFLRELEAALSLTVASVSARPLPCRWHEASAKLFRRQGAPEAVIALLHANVEVAGHRAFAWRELAPTARLQFTHPRYAQGAHVTLLPNA